MNWKSYPAVVLSFLRFFALLLRSFALVINTKVNNNNIIIDNSLNPRMLYTHGVCSSRWEYSSKKITVGVDIIWQKLWLHASSQVPNTKKQMKAWWSAYHFEVFGTHDETRSQSFWHVLSNETIRNNSEITEVSWVLGPGTSATKVKIWEGKDLSCFSNSDAQDVVTAGPLNNCSFANSSVKIKVNYLKQGLHA